MKTKKFRIALGLILALVFFYIYKKNINTRAEIGKTSTDIPASAIEGQKLPTKAERREEIAPTIDELKIMHETPVEFYGQVLDQYNDPVASSKINCSWAYISPRQSPVEILTDAQGRFKIQGLKASSISISIYPPAGYRELPLDPGKLNENIQIAEPPERIKQHEKYKILPPTVKSLLSISEPYKPDKNNPKVFRVEKLGATDAMYWKDIKDREKHHGQTRYFSLKNRTENGMESPAGEHSIGILFKLDKAEKDANRVDWKSNKQWSWSFMIVVPGGGIQMVTGDHDRSQPEEIFKNNETAPVAGYQPEILLDFPKGLASNSWKKATNAGYFIRFKDNTFARAVIYADDELISIKSYYNPTGSHNLTLDHSKRIDE